jgi:hypothetical protein
MSKVKSTFLTHLKNGIILSLLILGVSQVVMAVDGIITKSKSAKSSSFSNMKKNLTLNLHSGFTYHNNKSFGFKKVEKENSFNSIISYQKGNITYILPYKNKALLQKFKTPQKPAVR